MATADENKDLEAEQENENGNEEEAEETETEESGEESGEGEGEGEGSGESDDKPVSGKEFKQFQKDILKSLGTLKRHSIKNAEGKNIKKSPTDHSKNELGTRLDKIELSERKRTFGYENNLSPAEVDAVFKLNPNPTKKTLQDPFVQGGLEKLRASRNADANIPSGGAGRTFKVNGKSWGELDSGEKQSNFKAHQQAILSQKKGR